MVVTQNCEFYTKSSWSKPRLTGVAAVLLEVMLSCTTWLRLKGTIDPCGISSEAFFPLRICSKIGGDGATHETLSIENLPVPVRLKFTLNVLLKSLP